MCQNKYLKNFTISFFYRPVTVEKKSEKLKCKKVLKYLSNKSKKRIFEEPLKI